MLDVVILTWNDPPAMLASAIESVLQSGVDVKVFVVDNGSQPAARPDTVDERVQLVRSPRNLGVSVGRTVGVMLGSAASVAFLDSDARLGSGALRQLLDIALDRGVGVVGPAYVGQDPDESGGRAPTLRTKVARALNRRSTYEPPANGVVTGGIRSVDFVIGACQVFRREVWDAVHGLDTAIFYGPEDIDFCLRVAAAGYDVVQHLEAEVHHPPRRAARNLLSRRGLRHAVAVGRHLWRHRKGRSPSP